MGIKEVSELLVIGYDPSHSKSEQVALDKKILSILARVHEHERNKKKSIQNEFLNANELSKNYLEQSNNERLETFYGDEEDDLIEDDFNYMDFQDDDSDENDLNIKVKENDINQDVHKYNKK